VKPHRFVLAGIVLVAGFALLLPAAAGAAAKATRTITVTAAKPSEFRFSPSTKTFPHGTVVFKVKNVGTLPHDFKVCASPKGGTKNSCTGKGTKLIGVRGSGSLTYTFKTKGTYEYLCTVPGHAAAGMKGDFKVT
jgi:nitrite reductase (NO-forming)